MNKTEYQLPKNEEGLKPMSNDPNYIAYRIIKKDGDERSYWTKIGVGFLHRDGGGLNILLDCLPTDGRVTLRARPYGETSS